MREIFISERDQKRTQEIKQVKDIGETMAATQAALDMLLKVPADSAKEVRDKVSDFLHTCSRKTLISEIMDIQENCNRLQQMINPRCHDTPLAFHTRRLSILSRVITSGIADGQEAVLVTDLLVGLKRIDIGNLEIVKESTSRNIPNFQL